MKLTARCKVLSATMALAWAATTAAGDAPANGPPMIVAGGELDPAYPGADVYLEAPESPDLPPGKACAVAERYVTLINAGEYAEVAALYADDATFLAPMRPTLSGRDQIDEFYAGKIGGMQPTIAAVSYLGNDRECMVELALRTEIDGHQRYVLVAIDHLIIGDDGKIVSMTAFARPRREE